MYTDVNGVSIDVKSLDKTLVAFNEKGRFFIVIHHQDKDIIETLVLSYRMFFKVRKYIPQDKIDYSWEKGTIYDTI